MANDTRNGVLRGDARARTGVEGQDTRTSMGREEHLSRGSFVNYYDDLGISTTASGAKEIRSNEAKFNQTIAEQQGKVSGVKGQLEGAYKSGQEQISAAWDQLPGYKEAISESWNKTQKSLTPVHVVHGTGDDFVTEGTYYLPKEALEDLQKQEGVAYRWDDKGNFYVDTRTSKGGRTIGQELHDAFRQGQEDYYNAWYGQSAPAIAKQINEGRTALGEASNQLETSYATQSGEIGAAQSIIDSAVGQRNMDWAKMREDYTRKKATIAEIFGNFKVAEAK